MLTPFYDPLIARLIAHAPGRTEALARLASALDAVVAEGIRANTAFLARVLRSEAMQAGTVDTHFLEGFRACGAAA